jgi:hypothetical protein
LAAAKAGVQSPGILSICGLLEKVACIRRIGSHERVLSSIPQRCSTKLAAAALITEGTAQAVDPNPAVSGTSTAEQSASSAPAKSTSSAKPTTGGAASAKCALAKGER